MKVLAILLLLTSCVSKPPVPVETAFVLESADLTIRLTPLSREELRERHGANTDSVRNPFIDYPAQLLKKRIVVFETGIESDESEVLFHLDGIHLVIGGEKATAVSSELLMNYWRGYASQEEAVLMESLLRRTMLERKFSVSPDEPVEGYLVFAHPFPREGGEAMISFNVSTPAGDYGLLEQAMEFTKVEKLGRTGIFAAEP